jgi:hypothetical protein
MGGADGIAGRLDRLEREVRSWRRGGLILALALGGGLMLGARPAREERLIAEHVYARCLHVEDEKGRDVILLDGRGAGPAFRMMRDGGRPVAQLSAEEATTFLLYNAGGDMRVMLTAPPAGGGKVGVFDDRNEVSARLPARAGK